MREGQAEILPEGKTGFDPRQIAKAVEEAGFTPREVEVTAVGTLSAERDLLVLELPGPVRRFVLAGGAKGDELKSRAELRGKRVRITGALHGSHGDQPPGLTVEEWSAVEPAANVR